MFGWEMKGRKKRMMELAARFKECGSGDNVKFEEIKARFCVEVREETVNQYIDVFQKSGLLVMHYGDNTWEYNAGPEIEMFGKEIQVKRKV